MSDTLTFVPAFCKPGWTIYRDEHHFVAQVDDADDARLFAAAPQLLEACEELRAIVDEYLPAFEAALDKADAAISAAREG